MSSESTKPLIVVTGATGAQGASVVRFLLVDGSFRLRGVTRNVNSAKAQELESKGVEVVYGDQDVPESIDKAFQGAYGVFGLTDFWDHKSAEREIAQGKVLVDAAKKNNVKHFVYSTLEYTGLKCTHLDSKYYVDQYLKQSGLPHTSVYTTIYFENFILFPGFKLSKDPTDGLPVADWPFMWTDGPIGAYAVADTGAFVLEAFKNPTTWFGKDINIQSETFTPRQLVECIREVSGKQVKLVEVSQEAYESLKDTKDFVTYELWSNIKLFHINNGQPHGRDPAVAKQIYPQLQTMKDFVTANIDALLAV